MISDREFKYVPLILRYYQKLKNAINSKTYVFFIASNQKNIMITTEKVLQERKSVPLNIKFL